MKLKDTIINIILVSVMLFLFLFGWLLFIVDATEYHSYRDVIETIYIDEYSKYIESK